MARKSGNPHHFGQSNPKPPDPPPVTELPPTDPLDPNLRPLVSEASPKVARLILDRIVKPIHFDRLVVHYLFGDRWRANEHIHRDNEFGSTDYPISRSWFVRSDGEQIFGSIPDLGPALNRGDQ